MYCENCGREIQEGQRCTCEQKDQKEDIKKSSNQGIKTVIKIIFWIMIVSTLLSGFEVKSGMGNAKDGILEIVSYYVNSILLIVIPLLILMNFKGIRNRLPLFKKRKLGTSVVAFLLMSMILSVMEVTVSDIIDDMYSAEYKEQQAMLVQEKEQNSIQNTDEDEVEIETEVIIFEETEEKQEKEEDLTQEETKVSYVTEELESEDNYELEMVDTNELPVYSVDYLAQYIEDNNIKFPKEKYKSKIEKVLTDDSEMIAVEVSGSEKIRYSATVGNSEFYYVGKMKNNVPDGWGKIIRVVTAYESEYDGHLIANIGATSWGWSDEYELVPLLVYVGQFEDGYYSGYGWKYADYFESKSYYAREIGYDYVRCSDNIMENILTTCNPIEYMGEFKKSLYDGEGILISYGAREVPYDMTDEEQIELSGVVVEREIEFYVGEFKKDELRGEAKHYLLGKLLYEGEYRDWSYDGTGTLYYLGTTQKKYDGEWKNDKYHGKGTLYNEDGSIKYKGKWEMGDYAN